MVKRLTLEKNGWIGTKDKKYAFNIDKNCTHLSKKSLLSDEYVLLIIDNDIILELAEKIKETNN